MLVKDFVNAVKDDPALMEREFRSQFGDLYQLMYEHDDGSICLSIYTHNEIADLSAGVKRILYPKPKSFEERLEEKYEKEYPGARWTLGMQWLVRLAAELHREMGGE